MVSVNAGWLRTNSTVNKWNQPHIAHSSADFWYLSVNVIDDGFKITPWGLVGLVGSNVNGTVDEHGNYAGNPSACNMFGYGTEELESHTKVYWAGLGGELSLFDPFKFTADFIYSGNNAKGYAKREGWYVAIGAEIKSSFGTPFLHGWYASGDDADAKKSGRMPSMYGAGAFDASTIYHYGTGWLSASIMCKNPWGSWGAQLGVKDMSFMENLTHRLSLTYSQGTNNTNRLTSAAKYAPSPKDVKYMITSDSFWEIDFVNNYKLYKNLTVNMLLSYLITDFDKNIRELEYKNAFRGSMMIAYTF